MTQPTHLSLEFPVGGVDRSTEFELQVPGTTPTGVNVSSIDPATRRERGASRAGTSRWIDAQPAGSASMIQDLSVVVTASGDALLGSQESDGGVSGVPPGFSDPTGIPDPSTNNEAGGDPADPTFRNPDDRTIPDGGSGVPVPRDEPEDGDVPAGGDSSGWEFVQKAAAFNASSAGPTRTDQVTFAAATEKDQLIVVWVYTVSGAADATNLYYPTVAVTDSLGNTYTPLTAVTFASGSAPWSSGQGDMIQGFWCRNGFGGACTVNVELTKTHPTDDTVNFADVMVMEYRGLETSTPFDGEAAGGSGFCCNDGSVLTGTMTAGAVPITGQTRLVLGAAYVSTFGGTFTVGAGFTDREHFDVSGFLIAEELSSGASEEPTYAFDHSASPFSGVQYVMAAAGWRFR